MSDSTVAVDLPDPNESHKPDILACAITVMALAVFFVGLRFYARAGILKGLKGDDWFILVALTFSLVNFAGLIVQLDFGLGTHMVYVPADKFSKYLESGLLSSIAYALSLTFTKISILTLYIRVLTYPTLRLTAKVLMGIVIVSHLWILCALLTACVPLSAFWTIPDAMVHTVDPENSSNSTTSALIQPRDSSSDSIPYCHPLTVYWSHAGINVATDFLIFLLPLTILHKIRIPRPQKVALYIIFLVAFGVCVVSLVRVIDLAHAYADPAVDLTWIAANTAKWTIVEVNAAIVCACLTTVKPAVAKWFPGLLSSGQPRRRQHGQSPGWEPNSAVGPEG